MVRTILIMPYSSQKKGFKVGLPVCDQGASAPQITGRGGGEKYLQYIEIQESRAAA